MIAVQITQAISCQQGVSKSGAAKGISLPLQREQNINQCTHFSPSAVISHAWPQLDHLSSLKTLEKSRTLKGLLTKESRFGRTTKGQITSLDL